MGEYEAEALVEGPVERTFEVFTHASRFSQWGAAALRTWLEACGGVFG